MSRILVAGDVHLSQYSSIVRSRTDRFSTRLENIIQSVNWVIETAWKNKCDEIVFLGDFFDRETLNAEEITALSEINFHWFNGKITFITGNHELGNGDGTISSSNILKLIKGVNVVSKDKYVSTDNNTIIMYLPYILENDRKSMKEYFEEFDVVEDKRLRICFSHNDLKVNYGKYASTQGFDLDDIKENCDFFINGHIHNFGLFGDNVLNLGNLTGQNFNEDATLYKHQVMLLDTKSLSYELIENPYAINFYKLDFTGKSEEAILLSIKCVKDNAVLSITCDEKDVKYIEKCLSNKKTVIAHKLIVKSPLLIVEENKVEELTNRNHLDSFREYILNELGSQEVVMKELEEFCK